MSGPFWQGLLDAGRKDLHAPLKPQAKTPHILKAIAPSLTVATY